MISKRDKHLYFLRHCYTSMNINGLINGSLDVPICINDNLDVTELNSKSNLIILSSPLCRCRQTVDLFKDKTLFDPPVYYCNNLVERSMGIFEGQKRSELVKVYSNYFINDKFIYHLTPPGGESFIEFSNRVDDFIALLDNKLTQNNVLICAHNQIMKMIYFKCTGVDLENNWNMTNFINGKVYKIM